MRKSKTVRINDTEYDIKELTVKDIIELTQQNRFFGGLKSDGVEEESSNELSELNQITDDIKDLMKRCTNFNFEDVMEKNMTPSELKILYDTFTEVNSDFLGAIKLLGIMELIDNIKSRIISRFLKMLAT